MEPTTVEPQAAKTSATDSNPPPAPPSAAPGPAAGRSVGTTTAPASTSARPGPYRAVTRRPGHPRRDGDRHAAATRPPHAVDHGVAGVARARAPPARCPARRPPHTRRAPPRRCPRRWRRRRPGAHRPRPRSPSDGRRFARLIATSPSSTCRSEPPNCAPVLVQAQRLPHGAGEARPATPMPAGGGARGQRQRVGRLRGPVGDPGSSLLRMAPVSTTGSRPGVGQRPATARSPPSCRCRG